MDVVNYEHEKSPGRPRGRRDRLKKLPHGNSNASPAADSATQWGDLPESLRSDDLIFLVVCSNPTSVMAFSVVKLISATSNKRITCSGRTQYSTQ